MVLESNTLDVLFVKDGQQGEDGKVLYTWIKYAKDANGTGMTDDPNGAIYIGISYNNESSIESNDPTQYAWTKIQGAEGKKGEDAYTIFLENENISFATDENRDPLSEQAYTSGITIMKGAKPVTDFTIGDIAKTQGIAVAKTDTAIAISVINGNPLPSDNGEIVIPITVGGTVFKKILSWTCSKKGDKGIQGIQGPQGVQGEKGKDGTSVTISNKSITYQLSASGTVVPTGTWQTSPQTIPEGQYQWTKTSVTYSDGNKTESYSISYRGKNGSDGTSVKTTSTSVKYQVGDSGITKPTGTWQNSVPTVAQGKYLWTQTIVNYSDGNSTESYSVSYRGIDGSNGVNGMNAATIYLYQRATSTPSKPSNTLTYTFSTTKITGTLNNGWSTAIPTGTDAVYVTVASVSSKNDTATIATSAWSAPVVLAQNGKTGSDGKAGLNVATIYLYQRNTSKPSKPSASVAYTFSTGVASGLNNGWSQKIPDGTNPLYVTLATASSNTATDTILSSEWSDVVVMAQNGEDGISPKVSLSKTGGTTTISIVDATGTHTQSVKDGTNGTPGTDGKDGKTSYFHVKYSNDGGKTFTGNSGEDTGIYMGSYTDYTEADSTDVKKYNWVKVKGDKGDTGQKGQDGTSVKITSKSVTYQTSTSGTTAPTGTWVTTVPTVNNGQYLWTKTTVQYSDGNKTEAYSVSYKGTNGTNGTSVTVSKTEVTYQVSTSGTTAPTGTWSTTMPSCDQGQYLWTKTYVKYSDGKETTSYSVSYKGVDGEKFAFNMLRETNQGSKHWEQHSSGGKYSVEDFITEDNINAVKLICTEAISTSNWSYVSFKDIKMLKQLKPSTKYTLSYDIKANRSGTISHSICNGDASNFCTNTVVVNNIIGNETWQHISVVLTTNDLKTTPTNEILYLGRNALSKVGYSIIKNLKLTEGIVDTPWAPHPEDLEGRGVSQTVQYYLATSQAFGVTSSTSGWSTDITTQKLTADKKYLWNCYQTKYSDGTSEPISTPKVIGVYGDKGDNAKNLSITPSSQYFKSTDGGKTFTPDTITIKPTIQGEINFGKWQYSIDGGVSFADVMSGQKGLMISNNVLTVSKDSSLYSDAVTMVTFRAVASDSSFYDTCSIAKIYDVSDIGDGRNLLWNSNFAKTDETINTSTYTTWGLILRGSTYTATIDTSVKHNNFNTLKVIGTKAGENGGQDLIYRIKGLNLDEVKFTEIDVKYTLSFYAKASIACNFSARYSYDSYAKDTNVALSTDWKRYEIQMHPTTASYQTSLIFKMDAASTVWFSEFKLEKGSSATGYSTAPEDVQMEILSTKSEISDVSLKVDNNRQAIEQRVEKTTYEQDLNLVKGDISKANEGLNKWRYEIYPKSLFTSEYQGKSTMDVFAKNTNLTPSQSVLINDTDFGKSWAYGDNYIGYALTFVKFSAAKSIAITFKHDDGAHLYLNGKLIGGDDTCNTGSGESLTLSFIQGWNCLEVVLNEKSGGEYIGLGTTISAISECQLMNCYYGTPVARQSHITNQLVQNTTDIDGVSTKVSKVTSVIGDNGENFTSFKNDYSDFKQTMNGFKTTVGQTYVTKDDFNGLEIGGRNLVRLGGLSSNGATSFSYDKTTDIYTIVSPVVSTVWGIGAAVKYDDNHKVLIPYGKTYILSFEVKVPQALSINIDINNFAVSGSSWAGNDNDDGSMRGQSSYNIPANTWTKVWVRWANTNTKNTNKVDLYDNSSIGLVTKDCTSAITWQIRHVKGELGNKPTDWTPAPEDVNGKIVNVETIANQTAKKFEWIVKGGDSSSNFTLTDRVADLVAERINFKGLVTFSGLNTDAKNEIGKVAQSKVDGLEIGGRNLIINSNLSRTLTNVTNDGCSNMTVVSDSVYGHALKFTAVNQRRVFWATSNVWVKNKTYTVSFVAKSSVTGQKIRPSRSTADWGDDITLTTSYARYTTKITSLDTNAGGALSFSCTNAVGDITITNVKLEVGNKATDWTPAPEDVSQDATNKASQALTDAKNYSSNAVNWVTNNGSSTTSLNSMVKKWTDGAVSDTAQINGGWIKANTITASKIALADFTNYSQLTRDTADAYGFTVTDDTDGTWFSTKNIKRDQFISEIFPCNGGESYLIEYDISTNAKGANNSTDTKNYIGVAIGVYGYTGTVGSNGLPNKATNIWYADRITGSETAPSIHVKTTITTSTATKQFRVFLQSNGYYFEGTTKIRNLSVRRMYGGTLIVDGSITADKIATDAIKSRNYISFGGTQGSFLNLSDGSFQSPNLSWDSNGNLIAKNANLSGEITAKDGTIGKYKITDQWLITGSGSTCTGIGGNQAFWAGAEDSNSAPFRVNYDGSMISTKGKIGDWKIDKMGLYNDFIVTFGVDQSDGTWLETFYTNYSAKTLYKANAFNNIFLGNKICCMDTHTEYTYLNDNSNKGDITYVESVILENGRINLHSSQYSDSRFALIPYDNYGSHLTLSGEAIEFSSYEADGTYSERNVDAKYTYTYISSDTIKTADVYCSNILRTNNLLVYEIISGRDIHLTSSANQIQLNASNQGSIELYGQTPFIDFHYNYSGDDYTSRIIANGSNLLSITGNLWVDVDIHAGSWLYASEVHTSGAVVIASDSESFYWAHGYQIARGTSWGGVCVGDDSQQLRLYGSSIWAAHGISTSDENLKENFTTLDQYEDFYMNLNPIGFNYIGDYDGKKTHFGFGAHKTEDILESEGYDSDKFAVVTHRPLVQEDIEKRFGKDIDVDIETEYGVSYTEFIALNTHMIQKTRRELTKVKQEKADLEARLQAIEAKLGL